MESFESLFQLSNNQLQLLHSAFPNTQHFNTPTPKPPKQIQVKKEKKNPGEEMYEWLLSVEKEMEKEQSIGDYLNKLENNINQYTTLKQKFQTILETIQHLQQSYISVDQTFKSLQSDAESLLYEQIYLKKLSELLKEQTLYFSYLPQLQKYFNQQNIQQLLTDPNFHENLTLLDSSIQFMLTNHNYKDSGLYLLKYKQILIRAMGLIKLYFSEQLETIPLSVSIPTPQNDIKSEESDGRSHKNEWILKSQELKPMIEAVELRAVENEEVESILYDVMNVFFQRRKLNILPFIQRKVLELENGNTSESGSGGSDRGSGSGSSGNVKSSLLAFSKYGIQYIYSIIHEELEIYKLFFTLEEKTDKKEKEVDEEFKYFCKEIASPILDRIHSFMIYTTDFGEISQLCLLLMTYSTATTAITTTTSRTTTRDISSSNNIMMSVLEEILNDSQVRILFLCQKFIDQEILHYAITSEDFVIPTVATTQVTDTTTQATTTVTANDTTNSVLEKYKSFSKPFRNCLFMIEKIYLSIPLYLLKEIVGISTKATIYKVFQISKKMEESGGSGGGKNNRGKESSSGGSSGSGGSDRSKEDAGIFLMKHLLALREELGGLLTPTSTSTTTTTTTTTTNTSEMNNGSMTNEVSKGMTGLLEWIQSYFGSTPAELSMDLDTALESLYTTSTFSSTQ